MGKRGLALVLVLIGVGMLGWNHHLYQTANVYYRMPLVMGPACVLFGLFAFAFPDPDPRARWAHVASWVVLGVSLLCTAWLMTRY